MKYKLINNVGKLESLVHVDAQSKSFTQPHPVYSLSDPSAQLMGPERVARRRTTTRPSLALQSCAPHHWNDRWEKEGGQEMEMDPWF